MFSTLPTSKPGSQAVLQPGNPLLTGLSVAPAAGTQGGTEFARAMDRAQDLRRAAQATRAALPAATTAAPATQANRATPAGGSSPLTPNNPGSNANSRPTQPVATPRSANPAGREAPRARAAESSKEAAPNAIRPDGAASKAAAARRAVASNSAADETPGDAAAAAAAAAAAVAANATAQPGTAATAAATAAAPEAAPAASPAAATAPAGQTPQALPSNMPASVTVPGAAAAAAATAAAESRTFGKSASNLAASLTGAHQEDLDGLNQGAARTTGAGAGADHALTGTQGQSRAGLIDLARTSAAGPQSPALIAATSPGRPLAETLAQRSAPVSGPAGAVDPTAAASLATAPIEGEEASLSLRITAALAEARATTVAVDGAEAVGTDNAPGAAAGLPATDMQHGNSAKPIAADGWRVANERGTNLASIAPEMVAVLTPNLLADRMQTALQEARSRQAFSAAVADTTTPLPAALDGEHTILDKLLPEDVTTGAATGNTAAATPTAATAAPPAFAPSDAGRTALAMTAKDWLRARAESTVETTAVTGNPNKATAEALAANPNTSPFTPPTTAPANGLPSFASALAAQWSRDSSLAENSLSARPGTAEFATQASQRITLLVLEGVQTAKLQLNPAELGPVSVQIQLDGAAANVHLAVENEQTRQALEESLPQLASQLREAGLTLSGGGVFEQPRSSSQDPGQQSSHPQQRQPALADNPSNAPHAAHNGLASGGQRAVTRGLVDLVA